MTLEELAPKLQEIRDKLVNEARERVMIAAATAMKAEMQDRIFNRGEDVNGGKIGNYSQKAAYFTKEQFVRKSAFKAQGQNGFKGERVVYDKKAKTAKVVKKPPQSMFLKEGYKEFRDIQGRKTDTKNYKLTGSLEKSIQVVKKDKEILIAITDADESKKRHWLEKQDNKEVFKGSKSDLKVFRQAVSDEIEHIRHSL